MNEKNSETRLCSYHRIVTSSLSEVFRSVKFNRVLLLTKLTMISVRENYGHSEDNSRLVLGELSWDMMSKRFLLKEK